jgi:hypothetical protein
LQLPQRMASKSSAAGQCETLPSAAFFSQGELQAPPTLARHRRAINALTNTNLLAARSIYHGSFSHFIQERQEKNGLAFLIFVAGQSPWALQSTLNGFLFQKNISRLPFHQRQVPHFLSVSEHLCIWLFSLFVEI